MRAITLLSGGLDSAVATALAREHVEVVAAITCDYGQRAVLREIAAAKKFCKLWKIPHHIVALPMLAEWTNTALVANTQQLPTYTTADLLDPHKQAESARAVWVPNRNGLMINVAAACAESHACDAIIVGFNAEEAATFPDNSEKFLDAATHALTFSTANHVRVLSDTIALDKTAIVRAAVARKLPLEDCWPCYEGGDMWCRTCESCARFQRATHAVGLAV